MTCDSHNSHNSTRRQVRVMTRVDLDLHTSGNFLGVTSSGGRRVVTLHKVFVNFLRKFCKFYARLRPYDPAGGLRPKKFPDVAILFNVKQLEFLLLSV